MTRPVTDIARRRVILDCDPGLDDAVAIAVAFHWAEVVGITTVGGNVGLEHTTANALALCDLLGRAEVPVHAGHDVPLSGSLAHRATEYHGPFALGDMADPSRRCRGCLLPSPTPPRSGCPPASTGLLRQTEGGSFHPTRIHSASWRTRRSWSRITGTPAAVTSRPKAWPTESGRIGSPISLVNTRSLADAAKEQGSAVSGGSWDQLECLGVGGAHDVEVTPVQRRDGCQDRLRRSAMAMAEASTRPRARARPTSVAITQRGPVLCLEVDRFDLVRDDRRDEGGFGKRPRRDSIIHAHSTATGPRPAAWTRFGALSRHATTGTPPLRARQGSLAPPRAAPTVQLP